MKMSQLRVSESPSLALVAEVAITGNERQPDILLDNPELPVKPAYGLYKTVKKGGQVFGLRPPSGKHAIDGAVPKIKKKSQPRLLAPKQVVSFSEVLYFDMPHIIEVPASGATRKMQRRRREKMREAGRTTFPGKVVIEERELALQHAKGETDMPLIERLVLWTDGSRFRSYGLSGAGVVFRTSNCPEWATKSFTLRYGLYSGSEDTELFAIKSAIDIAVATFAGHREAGQPEPALSTLVIYNDCSSVLANIASWEPYTVCATHVREPLFRHISRMSGRLQELGVRIELRWVPGHSEVPGNELAHRVAQAAAYASHSSARASASHVVACSSESTQR